MQPDGPMRRRYEDAGIPVIHFSPGGSLVGRGALAGARAMARFLRAEGIDVVHCHDRYSNVFCGLAARIAGVPLITSKRWWTLEPAHRLLNALAYHASARVLANSDAVASSLQSAEWLPRSRVVVVPNFVDDDAFSPIRPEERASLRIRFGIPHDADVIGIVARLRAEKNHAMLLRAAAALAPRRPSLHVVIVGDGLEHPDARALPELVRSLGLAGRVHFAGFVAPRDRSHAAFDVSVLSSDHEGFPNTLVEAMAVGRPVVSTDVGGVRDAVVNGETGLLVPSGDASAMADAIGALLDDSERARTMGNAGYQRAWNKFRRHVAIARLGELYQDVAARPARRSSGTGIAR